LHESAWIKRLSSLSHTAPPKHGISPIAGSRQPCVFQVLQPPSGGCSVCPRDPRALIRPHRSRQGAMPPRATLCHAQGLSLNRCIRNRQLEKGQRLAPSFSAALQKPRRRCRFRPHSPAGRHGVLSAAIESSLCKSLVMCIFAQRESIQIFLSARTTSEGSGKLPCCLRHDFFFCRSSRDPHSCCTPRWRCITSLVQY